VQSREVNPGRFAHQFWIWGDRVFWHCYEIPGADAASFGYLNDIWACDNKHIYSTTSRIRDADYDTFEVLNPIFAKDKNHVYCKTGICKNCDASTFEVLDDAEARYVSDRCGYARDAHNVFYHDSGEGSARPLRGADRNSFHVLKDGFATDGRRIYVFGRWIKRARIDTFRPLGHKYSVDGSHAFYLDVEVKGADLATFEVIGNEYAKDRHHVYRMYSIIEGAYPGTFQPPFRMGSRKGAKISRR
jgi:hypothetical protein